VTTLHDAIPLLLPGHAPRARKTRFLPLFRWCLQESVRRSAAVVTVSETSRRDIVRALRLDGRAAGRVHVIPNGVDARFVPAPAAARRPVSATRTVLYVGRLDPYKDVVGLVRAFGMLRRRCTFPLHLAIVGPEDPRYPEARQIAESLGLKECVSFLGFLQPSELLAAYQEADLLVNPSHYEGFGLPLIEAMRCGLPVVCTDGGAQPEVAGDAAVIVPAGDDHALTEGMLQVLADDALRTGLVARGLRRAEQFSWERSAVALLALYRCILQPEMHGP
jgi:glycosyltransferase involved in cell wall biosynthesis